MKLFAPAPILAALLLLAAPHDASAAPFFAWLQSGCGLFEKPGTECEPGENFDVSVYNTSHDLTLGRGFGTAAFRQGTGEDGEVFLEANTSAGFAKAFNPFPDGGAIEHSSSVFAFYESALEVELRRGAYALLETTEAEFLTSGGDLDIPLLIDVVLRVETGSVFDQAIASVSIYAEEVYEKTLSLIHEDPDSLSFEETVPVTAMIRGGELLPIFVVKSVEADSGGTFGPDSLNLTASGKFPTFGTPPAGIAYAYADPVVRVDPTSIFATDPDALGLSFSGPSDRLVSLTEGEPVDPVPAVPLPAGVVLLGSALCGFGAMRRRRSRFQKPQQACCTKGSWHIDFSLGGVGAVDFAKKGRRCQ